ncbi:BPK_HP2_G0014690.mRNA.1.CDS.1 [Saccharomyces cerevisiae]|uniref:Conserved oligomeric Golgi complex subunit 3 n=1 Tax=Saccharomyces cerevisiae x Saccharomyces kudriavzevii (strain VIN7) TaxID=1095631 RepID=H0GFG2_SACCK|nr:Cog3p [Saccharomyces cerevisiae YJM693]AJU45202.1 Cog3p [Saccharomyces cerevisiae YJM1250]AJU46978.1 Cog3p [Saccharomyces cerevisiae YJM1326]AJU49280.1 Cog3p [Saccharomyces cerevisiae YJM1383]AJU49529.1 Cog3p [Saccharomyces cerevisiae YJM1385]AJU51819.1 Cog3p [Saccharomyces cerevisiae YJM1415]AJU52074.1 Cog3p [Saccharomyces cerevisiae YJM1417]AJU54850.1 Cog3p [Saccharomyces cerevisiae YJM1463]AJV32967.1 Cog3p [Saccharomyces cerevisiae YJM189]AJV33738.1 Cog3p [Saccharomyces cerevisiae YJ
MARSRKNSLVRDIASHPTIPEAQTIVGLLDDSYLFDKLKKLSLAVENSDGLQRTDVSEGCSEVNGSEATTSADVKKTNKYLYYTTYLDRLNIKIDEYKVVLDQTRQVNDQLDSSIKKFRKISQDTGAFIEETKTIYEKQSKLSNLTESIPKALHYFEVLDPIMRRLKHATSPAIVKKSSFTTMLATIDESLRFLDENSDLKDAAAYRIKFKQCLIRACELISHFLTNLLKQTNQEILDKTKNKNSLTGLPSTTRDAFLYSKFYTIADTFKTQVSEIVKRSNEKAYNKYHDELNSILYECFNHYFQTRLRLLTPVIWSHIDEIVVKDKDQGLVKFIQDGKVYFQQLCADEYKLFVEFFPEKECHFKINQWFLQLCEPLYDSIRVRVLKETDICTLCDSVTLFAPYYEFEEGSEEYVKQFTDIQYDKLFEPIVQKVQARLILRVQIYVQQNILSYRPTRDVFMISNRRRKSKTSLQGGNEDATTSDDNPDPLLESYLSSFKNRSILPISPNDADDKSIDSEESTDKISQLQTYYPPLLKTLALLSKIYEMINSVVFDDLAHHVVHDCIVSLRNAYDMVIKSSAGKSDFNNLDISLAYLKNLLMLRDSIQNFNIQYTVNETYLDFSGVEGFFKSLKENGRNVLKKTKSSSILTLARELVPKVVNNMVDARTELISELRNVIKDFTESTSLELIDDTLDINSDEDLLSKNVKLRENIKARLPRIYEQILNYIDDQEIVTNLLDAVQELITQSYSKYYETITELAENGKFAKDQVADVMYLDVFTDFFAKEVADLLRNGDIDTITK